MSYFCECPTHYMGADCATHNPCGSQPCVNGGTCIIVGSTYQCSCNLGYSGDNCIVSGEPYLSYLYYYFVCNKS